MERADWTVVAHAGMEIMNPLPAAKLDDVVDALGPLDGARAIDLGCGKGALVGRLNDRGASGIGVDLARELLAEAALRAPDFELLATDATAFATPERFDVAAGVGSPATLQQLVALVARGGHVLYGDGYWRREPTDEYLAALGASRDELTDYAGIVAAAAEHGLEPRYAVTPSVDDFDRYEWRWSLNGERYAAAHPDEPGVDAFLAWVRNGRRRYVELGGRETLGFGLFLFERVA